jgi:hypothetical protein
MAGKIRHLFDRCLTLQQSVKHQLPGHAEHTVRTLPIFTLASSRTF